MKNHNSANLRRKNCRFDLLMFTRCSFQALAYWWILIIEGISRAADESKHLEQHLIMHILFIFRAEKETQRKIEWKFNQKCALCYLRFPPQLQSVFNNIATMILFNENTQQNSHRFTVKRYCRKFSITFRLTFFSANISRRKVFNKRNLARGENFIS